MSKINLDKLTTENRNYKTLDIDKVSTIEMARLMNNEDKTVPIAVEKEILKIAEAIDNGAERVKKGGRIIYIGAGTSGRLGILDASECPPTYSVSSELVQAIIAGGYEAIFKAKEGAEDSKELGIIDLKSKKINELDVVVGIAASGRTPYAVGALEYANKIGAYTISISCTKDSEISKISKTAITPVVGAEVITGSTRLKSGTAQKLVLNMLSTGIMIKLGKVYSNLMIDVKPTNEKLIERAKNIIQEATGCTRKVAEEYFEESNRNVKLAVFMILSNKDKEEGKKILKKYENNISKAIKSI